MVDVIIQVLYDIWPHLISKHTWFEKNWAIEMEWVWHSFVVVKDFPEMKSRRACEWSRYSKSSLTFPLRLASQEGHW